MYSLGGGPSVRGLPLPRGCRCGRAAVSRTSAAAGWRWRTVHRCGNTARRPIGSRRLWCHRPRQHRCLVSRVRATLRSPRQPPESDPPRRCRRVQAAPWTPGWRAVVHATLSQRPPPDQTPPLQPLPHRVHNAWADMPHLSPTQDRAQTTASTQSRIQEAAMANIGRDGGRRAALRARGRTTRPHRKTAARPRLINSNRKCPGTRPLLDVTALPPTWMAEEAVEPRTLTRNPMMRSRAEPTSRRISCRNPPRFRTGSDFSLCGTQARSCDIRASAQHRGKTNPSGGHHGRSRPHMPNTRCSTREKSYSRACPQVTKLRFEGCTRTIHQSKRSVVRDRRVERPILPYCFLDSNVVSESVRL